MKVWPETIELEDGVFDDLMNIYEATSYGEIDTYAVASKAQHIAMQIEDYNEGK